MKNILMVCGSLREKSFNRQLMTVIEAELKGRAKVRELAFSNLPCMNQDIEWPTPTEVRRVRDDAAWADGMWFVCPEYNGFFPGHVKNLVDWLSRPTVAGDYGSVVIAGKHATMSGCAGRSGSRTMQGQLATLLTSVRMQVMDEPTAGLVIPSTSWATDVLELSEADREAISKQVAAFLGALE